MNRIATWWQHRTRNVDGLGTIEPEYLAMPLSTLASAVKAPPCILAHGAGTFGSGVLETYGSNGWNGVSALLTELAQNFTVIQPYLGGDLWGSNTHVARIESARQYLISLGSTGPVTLVGYSMGHTGVVHWAVNNPTLTRCVIGIEGVQDIDNLYTRFPGAQPNFGNAIDSAYASGDHTLYSPNRASMAGALGNGDGTTTGGWNIPTCELFASNDSVVLPATTRQFVVNYLGRYGVSPYVDLSTVWPSGNAGSGQNGNYGSLWWREVGALDHSDAAILAAAPYASQFAQYLTL